MRNRDGVAFEDVTADTGVPGAEDAWSTGAAFFDADGDGDLDLFVCNYVGWSPDIDRAVDFRLTGIGRAYGPPTDFPGTDSYLYRNDGGVFTDVSAEAGIHVANPSTGAPVGKGLAVLPVDLDDDGHLDLVVANDTVRNFVFHNQGGGRFQEVGIDTGLAFDNTGSATGAMGVDALRFGGGTLLGVAIGNFANEMSSFYVTRTGENVFSDDAIVTGIGAPSRRALTFGLAFVDADLDGRLDLSRRQRPRRTRDPARPGEPKLRPARATVLELRHRMPPPLRPGRRHRRPRHPPRGPRLRLRRHRQRRRPRPRTNPSRRPIRPAAQRPGPSVIAGCASRCGEPGTTLNAIGARIVVTAAGRQQTRTVMPTRSYLSQVELPVTFGLGDAAVIERVDVAWPDGGRDSWRELAVNRGHVFSRGGL